MSLPTTPPPPARPGDARLPNLLTPPQDAPARAPAASSTPTSAATTVPTAPPTSGWSPRTFRVRPPRFADVAEIALGQSLIDEAFARALTDDLRQLLDRDVRLLVLNGSGAGFMVEAADGDTSGLAPALSELLDVVVRSGVMIVSVCGGHAVGIGALLLLLSDYRIGISGIDWRLVLPEFIGGGSLSEGTARFVLDQIAPQFERRVLLGVRISAAVAADAGFIDEFCAVDDLDGRLAQVISRLMSSGSAWRSVHGEHLSALAGATEVNSGQGANATMMRRAVSPDPAPGHRRRIHPGRGLPDRS